MGDPEADQNISINCEHVVAHTEDVVCGVYMAVFAERAAAILHSSLCAA